MLNDSQDLISIVMPAYNTADFIGKAIESVQAQTLKRWELLVVNDGSTDATAQVVERYAQVDPRVQHILIDNLGSAGKVRNVGLQRAQGRFLAFLDSDDEYLPDALEVLLKALLADDSTSAVYALQNDMDELGNVLIRRGSLDPDLTAYVPSWEDVMMGRTYYNFGALLLKREALNEVGLIDSSLRFAEDRQYAIRLRLQASGSVKLLRRATFNYRIRHSSITKVDDTISTQLSDEVTFLNWLFSLPALPDELKSYRSQKFMSMYRAVAGIRFGASQQRTARKALKAAWQDKNVTSKDWFKGCGILFLRTYLPKPMDNTLTMLLKNK
jgi:glycosyltransferase involved in cell wall biosynthesis